MQLEAYLARAECNDVVMPPACFEHVPLIPPDVDERIRHPPFVLVKDDVDLRAREYDTVSLVRTSLTVPTRRLR